MQIMRPITYLVFALACTNGFAAENKKSESSPKVIVRIASLNGKQNPNHKKEIQMRPGQRVKLTADRFIKVNGKLEAQKTDGRNFIWRLDYANRCDVGKSTDCLRNGITVTQDGGISFTLPRDMTSFYSVFVEDASDSAKTDQLTILNLNRIEEGSESSGAGIDLDVGGFFARNFLAPLLLGGGH